MEIRLKAMDEDAAINAVEKMLQSGSGYEAVLQYLRDCKYDQIDSIKVMRSAMKTSMNEAKKLVHYSRTWADRRSAAEAIHEAAFEAIKEMQREDS